MSQEMSRKHVNDFSKWLCYSALRFFLLAREICRSVLDICLLFLYYYVDLPPIIVAFTCGID